MTTTFTPGPWYVHDDTQIHEGKLVGCFGIITKPSYVDGNKVIGNALPYGGNFPTRDEAKANAKLIAAAPDLLTALQDIVKVCRNSESVDDLLTIKNIANGAIEKATL